MSEIRFEYAEQKARELEAQAKRMRRESKAKRQKAYADALLKYLPEVANCATSSEVDAYVAAHVITGDNEGAGESSNAPENYRESMDNERRHETSSGYADYPGYGSTTDDD